MYRVATSIPRSSDDRGSWPVPSAHPSWALDIKYLLNINLHINSPVGLYARIDKTLYITLVLYLVSRHSLPALPNFCAPNVNENVLFQQMYFILTFVINEFFSRT